MSTRHLDCLFRPRAVVVVTMRTSAASCSAEDAAGDVARRLLHNLADGGFAGPVMQVAFQARLAADADALAGLPATPDLALICPDVEGAVLPQLIDALGRRGTRAAVLLMRAGTQADVARAIPAALAAARPYRMRLLGPGSAGVIVPSLHLHASLAPLPPTPDAALPVAPVMQSMAGAGMPAFVAQSGALMSTALAWATARGIGFSKLVALGAGVDIDVADLLDFLARDPQTSAILLHLEQVGSARKFLSAARAAARGKPVVILKAGRVADCAAGFAHDFTTGLAHDVASDTGQSPASHAGALTGADDAADAAIRRAGMLRVERIEDLFGAAQILAPGRPVGSDRLRIVANGAGPGLLAADALLLVGGRLAAPAVDHLSPDSATAPGNPLDLGFDATPGDFAAALERLSQIRAPGHLSDGDDAILVVHAPSATAPAAAVADALISLLTHCSRTILSCWMGGGEAAEARRRCAEAGIPSYGAPSDAVAAFRQMVQYRRNQALLMQVPPSVRRDARPRHDVAQALIDSALAAGRADLSEPQAKALLAAYGIPVVPTVVAATADAAGAAAESIGFPVALKIIADGVVHKSDVGGVVLELASRQAVVDAARAMQARVAQTVPGAAIGGFSVQAMARRGGQELIVGAVTDPVFGPVILFGQGGTAVEIMDDKSVGLPPLNRVLARDMVSRTRVARLLAGYRNQPAADLDAICDTLVQLAYLVSDLPEVVELDINPLLADARGVLALDAHVRLARSGTGAAARLAISPYPQELEQWVDWQGSAILLRPIRPEDGEAHLRFVQALDPDDVRYRMFVAMRQLPPAQLARFTQIDYDREMAFIATRPDAARQDAAQWETIGVARVVIDAATNEAEFAIIVRSDLKGRGLGTILMQALIAYCRSRGVVAIVGEALSENDGLRRLARRLGFTIDAFGEQGTRGLRLGLAADPTGSRDPPRGLMPDDGVAVPHFSSIPIRQGDTT